MREKGVNIQMGGEEETMVKSKPNAGQDVISTDLATVLIGLRNCAVMSSKNPQRLSAKSF